MARIKITTYVKNIPHSLVLLLTISVEIIDENNPSDHRLCDSQSIERKKTTEHTAVGSCGQGQELLAAFCLLGLSNLTSDSILDRLILILLCGLVVEAVSIELLRVLAMYKTMLYEDIQKESVSSAHNVPGIMHGLTIPIRSLQPLTRRHPRI